MKRLVLTALLLSGCVNARIHDDAAAARRAFRVYRAAVVPDPRYGPTERDAVKQVGQDLDEALAAIESASR